MSLFSAKTPSGYLILESFTAQFRNYKISSIRMDDALPIMRWRNEQISALRQQTPLTEEELAEALFQIDQSDDNEFSFDELWMWWISDKIDDQHM